MKSLLTFAIFDIELVSLLACTRFVYHFFVSHVLVCRIAIIFHGYVHEFVLDNDTT